MPYIINYIFINFLENRNIFYLNIVKNNPSNVIILPQYSLTSYHKSKKKLFNIKIFIYVLPLLEPIVLILIPKHLFGGILRDHKSIPFFIKKLIFFKKK